ncbi:kinesin-like protein KIN-10B isoform X2 [Hordeum vulgare subsp. vulgare]|uniref:kinesin-like protein KIN-10B isoform X2 n=1 Tax=Hordeum vulgare subsp. vulgare TaxID=112509 RepID=UPI001D1A56ED|nr:kinesin-like protein KIN-10B isoform X2 [Hordeum vulgare subsp. vulgare]
MEEEAAVDLISMEEEAVTSGGDGGVRVVARICPAPTAPAAGFQVAASRGRRPRASGPGAGAVLSFTPAAAAPTPSSSSQGRAAGGQRKEEHRLDWCYLHDDTNHQVFLHELHPILHHQLHQNQNTNAGSSNACVVACGAAAAKDHLFKGSQEQPGLVTIAMEEILGFAASIGGSVRVSFYQVVQDTHVLDLLEPKEQEVLVLEDAQGKTHLKGLSKVHVRSIDDFVRLGYFDDNQDKQQQQLAKPFSTQQQPAKSSSTQLPTRGHQGLIIHVSTSDQDGKERAVAKINFLSLTDYVDPKHKIGSGGAALSSGNKSMYTLMNVVQALNSNQSFVPYRQSKVTRILQDSLCKTSGAVVIACLEEVSCQDAVSTLSLAARSSQVATQVANEQCRRSAIITSFKRADANLSAVAKSSSRPILSSMNLPNPVVEKQDRPQWNMSAVKASRTPVPNKRSRPIMHSAKKSENSLATPIKITQKDATPTMSGRSQPIMHSAKKSENSLATPIKITQKDATPTMSGRSQPIMHSAKKSDNSLATPIKITQKDATPTMSGRSQPIMHSAKKSENSLTTPIKITQKDATPTMSGRSQPIMHSAKKPESTVSPPTKMKQKDGKPAMSGRSQVIMRSAKKTDSSLSTSTKWKQKDAKPTMSGSALLCPSTNSAKEDIAPATVTKVEEVLSSQGVEIDAPSADEGFDKTSDALDTASSEIHKVVSSGMEEEDYSSSALDAASSCTIDLGEICSPNIPDALVEKTLVKTIMNTPKISDKLREISNSLKLLNARPLSVMPQKIAMEKTQEQGMEKTQKVAMEPAQEVGMKTAQEVDMETTQEVSKERTQEVGMETTQEVGMETTQEVAVETTQAVGVETTQEVVIETTQEVAVETTQEVAVETTEEVSINTREEVAIKTTQEVAVETTKEVVMENVQGVTNIDAAAEPKTPALHLKLEQAADTKAPGIHLKFEQAADHPASSFKTPSTGIKRSIVQECMNFLNSANKEQLKSLKGIGEKRANYIIKLREHSPELFKGIDDLRDVIGMNKREINNMMSGIITDSP